MELVSLIKSGLNSSRAWIFNHSSELEIGFGIMGFATAIGFGVRAGMKAAPEIEKRKKELGVEKLTPKETVQTVGKMFIPTVGTAVASSVLVIHGTKSLNKANAALATAYSITEAAFKDYQEKVVEVVGEKKEKQIRDEISKEAITKNPPPANTELMINTGYGKCIAYEPITKKYILTSPEAIYKAVNNYNRRLIGEMWLPFNEFTYDIGIQPTAECDIIGNDVDHPLEVYLSAQLDDNERPVLVINYREHNKPKREYTPRS